ncbi:MAG: hypothetical protein KDJ51_10590 [Nitratireductor sp.]|nr:hypothetical protein [Nitratireductor sp.]
MKRQEMAVGATGTGRIAIAVMMMAAAIVAGCKTEGKINPTAGGGGLAGDWRPDGGGYTAQLQSGVFSTIAGDTGNVISQGNYVAISETQVNLEWKSNITGASNSAQCLRPDPNTLNCTDAGGKSFVLRRT